MPRYNDRSGICLPRKIIYLNSADLINVCMHLKSIASMKNAAKNGFQKKLIGDFIIEKTLS